jgi:glycosyltransferase involved in cell wall biosynthesis
MTDKSATSSLPFVSVVLPVKNGAGRLETCLQSLRQQTYPKDSFEIIVADGRSVDATVAIAQSFGCIVVDNPRETVAGGRNAGVSVARGDLIAFSEDDMDLPPTWLMAGVRALDNQAIVAVGGPTPIPETSKPFSKAVDFIFRLASLSGYSVQSGIDMSGKAASDIPGGNAIYRREAFALYGPVDESLITGEDVDFHLRLRAHGYLLAFSPAFIAHHCKRDSPTKFFKQIRRFAQGRIQLARRYREALRPLHYLMALTAPAALLLGVQLGTKHAAIAILGVATTAVLVGVIAKLPIRAAAWLPIAGSILVLGWCAGFFLEALFKTRDATGK